MPMTLLSSLNRLMNCQKALDLERSNGGERTESKINAGKTKIMICGTGLEACFNVLHWSGQQQHLL